MLRYLVGLWIFVLCALPAMAEPYRLIIGDRVIVNYDFLDEPKRTTVDLDGNIRLAEIGSIVAVNRTLVEIETAISDAISKGGFSGVSFVLVEIDEYAPVVVSGFVERSGRYDFLPGMDIGTALALAGGFGSGDFLRSNADVLTVNARRRAASASEKIARAVVDIARLEAALEGPKTPVVLSDELLALVPSNLIPGMEARVSAEAALLAERRTKMIRLVASYNSDISDFTEQTELLDGRIVLKTDIVAKLASELADLEALRSQQLTTASRLSVQQQRLSDDREELLGLETAKIAARRAATAAARNRDQFLADRRDDDLTELEDARDLLDSGQLEYRFALDELTVLSEDTEEILEDLPALDVRFEIRGPRADRFGDTEIGIRTILLPGDVVLVEVNDNTGGTP